MLEKCRTSDKEVATYSTTLLYYVGIYWLNSSQRNSTIIYGRRRKTSRCPHSSSHYCI